MDKIEVYSPYDEKLITSLPTTNEQQAMASLETLYETYQKRDKWLPPYERIKILIKACNLLEQRRDELAMDAAKEGGKPLMDSRIEADRAIKGVEAAISHLYTMGGTEIPMGLSAATTHRMAYTYREPTGVVFSISAFNHPLNLIIHQVIPAVAVGCPVLVKPATSTPISCRNVIEILYEAGLSENWCQMILCDNDVAEKLVGDPRISFLSFIGSSRVGWYLRSKLPPGAHCALEHGGAAPVIVEPDANLEDAIQVLMKGGFYHAGQVCVSVQRMYVHKKIVTQVAEQMAQKADQLIVGDPTDPKTEVGPLIRKEEVERVDSWVQEAVSQGAKLLCGGKKISATCYAPTILLNPSETAQVSQKEIFGPIVCIYSYDNYLDAIEQANSLPFCFQGAVFTKHIDRALDIVKRLKATAVMVNDSTAFRADWMPFGGREASGLNMGGIPYSMHDMSVEKLMVIRSQVL